MYVCGFCESESLSVSAMLACEQQCGEDARNTRGFFDRKDVHRKD